MCIIQHHKTQDSSSNSDVAKKPNNGFKVTSSNSTQNGFKVTSSNFTQNENPNNNYVQEGMQENVE